VIRAAGVSYTIRGKALVDRVSLDVVPGQFLALVGANGAGKSTLLKLLAGELKPSNGAVTLDDGDLHRFGDAALARRRAVLPQGIPLPALTVAETVTLGRLPHHRAAPGASDAEVVSRAMEDAGLTPWAERLMPTLSGGEAQRVHLARVQAQLEGAETGTRYCFLDEPTSALDLSHQLELMHRLRRWAAAGWGVIAAVHDLNLAARFADRVAVLRGGQLAACGTPADVLTADLLEHAFRTRAAVIPHPVLGHPLILPLESQ
jgi:iron complex transport system ATP-binding protein